MSVDKTRTPRSARTWTNPSVRKLLKAVGDVDPVRAITQRAREAALDAMDHGWTGPPFDPLQLADHLGISVSPRHDVGDARTVPAPGGKMLIEFNPNRPSARIRYSIAHEIAHTLFPDCGDRIRHRGFHDESQRDEWQLEAMCNIGAAELLMPLGSLKSAADVDLKIESLLTLRTRFEVSMEALLIRIVRLTEAPVRMFCASPTGADENVRRFSLSYTIGSRAWHGDVDRDVPPTNTVLSECTAIGFTASAVETWGRARVRVEAVAIPPYPGSRHPRVVGVLRRLDKGGQRGSDAPSLKFVRGDALKPRGSGPRMVVHIVNDKTPNWGGGGFAEAIKRRWPDVQADFRKLIAENRHLLTLGNTRIFRLPERLFIASVVAQKGYGESVRPRIRYSALRKGLEAVAEAALQERATVHMPRIGAGQGRGTWSVIEDIVQTVLADKGIPVTIYDLPGAELPDRVPLQDELSFAENS